MYDKVGSLDAGKLANFIITTGPAFDEKTIYLQNWVQGKEFLLTNNGWNDYRGNYKLTIKQNNNTKQYDVMVDGKPGKLSATIKSAADTAKKDLQISVNNNTVTLSWSDKADSSRINSLSGIMNSNMWNGSGYDVNGNVVAWNMMISAPYVEKPDTSKPKQKKDDINKTVLYPFVGYGFTQPPKQEDVLIKNATVWTNETDSILQNTDVLLKAGKIAAIGKNLSAAMQRLLMAPMNI